MEVINDTNDSFSKITANKPNAGCFFFSVMNYSKLIHNKSNSLGRNGMDVCIYGCSACGFLVSTSGIEPGSLAVKALSPNH